MNLPSGELSGREISQEIRVGLSVRVQHLRDEGITIGLDLLCADPNHKPSSDYLRLKKNAARNLGIEARRFTVDTVAELLPGIKLSNSSPDVHGIVLQLPLKKEERHLTDSAINTICLEKDVDGLRKDSKKTPATPKGIIRLMEGYRIDPSEHTIAVGGLGRLVGRPVSEALVQGGAKVLTFDLSTPKEEKRDILNESRIIISAMGSPDDLTPEWFDDMTMPRILIDAGTAEKDGIVCGDVSDELREAALLNQWGVSTKHGSVGLLTVTSLMENTVDAVELVS